MADRTMDVKVRLSVDRREAAAQLRQMARDLDGVGAAGSAASDGLGDISDANREIERSSSDAAEAQRDVGRSGREAGNDIQEGLDPVAGVLDGIKEGLSGAVAAMVALVSVEGLRQLIGFLQEAGQHAHKLQEALQFTAGGPELAEAKLRSMTAAAALLGEEVDSVVEAYAKLGPVTSGQAEADATFADLTKSAKDAGAAINDVVDASIELRQNDLAAGADEIKAYMNIAAASGKSLQDFVSAVGEAADGEYDALEAFGIKAETVGKTVVLSARGMAMDVEADSKKVVAALKQIGLTEFAGAVPEQSETIGDALSRIGKAAEILTGQSDIASWIADVSDAIAEGAGGIADKMLLLGSGAAPEASRALQILEAGLKAVQNPVLGLPNLLSTLNEKVSQTGATSGEAAHKVQTLAQIMAELAPKAEGATNRVSALDEKLKNIGVTALELNTGLSATESSAVDAFDAMLASADVASAGLVRGLEATLNRVSEKSIPGIAREWLKAKDSGRITAEQYAAGAELIRAKMESLDKATSKSAQAAKEQGAAVAKAAASAAELAAAQRQASSAQAAYVAAQRNGLASADELGRAWQRAEAEVQKLKAGAGGVSQALSGAGTATQAAADKASALAKAEVAAGQAHAAYQQALASGAGDVAALGQAWESAEAKVRRLKTAAQEAGQTVGKASKDQAAAAAAEAAALDAAIAAHVSYGQWVERSGEADRAAINARAELAKAIGDQGDRVRDLTQAYIEAQKNQGLGDDDSAARVKALAGELGEAKAKYEDLQRQLADKAQVDIQVKTEGADQAKAEIDQLAEPTESTHSITTNAGQALSEIDQLAGHDTSSTHTVYVRTVEQHTLGGLVGQFLLHRAGGGSVFNRPGWSIVPGVGNVDSVPAGLPSGAYVLRKAAARYYGPLLARLNAGGIVPTLLTPGERWFGPGTVRKHGLGLFEALNRLQIPRDALAARLAGAAWPAARFNAGGPVGATAAAASADRGSIDINLTVGRETVRLQGARDQAMALARALKELQRGA